MNNVELYAFAKVNLFLDILNKCDDGFHDIKTIFHEITLCDKMIVSIKKRPSIDIVSNRPIKGKNILLKVYEILLEKYSDLPGIDIKLEKNIPIGGGLAGGSTNAATLLKFMNQEFHLNLNYNELVQIGKTVGSDVPFFYKGGTQIGFKRGTDLKQLENIELFFVLIAPEFSISTKKSYESLTPDLFRKGRQKFEIIKKGFLEKNIHLISDGLYNIFEYKTFQEFPVLKTIKTNLLNAGALNALMSGTGSTMVGLFDSFEKAQKSYFKLKKIYKNIFLTKSNV